jgi:hypothetical protein
MPPTTATAGVGANNNHNNGAQQQQQTRRRRTNHINSLTSMSFASTAEYQHQPWFLGSPISKLLCFSWVLGSLWIIRSGGGANDGDDSIRRQSLLLFGEDGNNNDSNASSRGVGLYLRLLLWNSIDRWFFHTTTEVVVGLGFMAHYLRRLERELSSQRLVVWLFVVETFYTMTQLVCLATLDYEATATYVWESTARGPYVFVGGILYWYWMFVPRLHPRFVSIPMLGMYFSEKSFGFLWAIYVLSMKGLESLLVGVMGMVASSLFFFLLSLPSSSAAAAAGGGNRSSLLSMDVPNFIVNMMPWDSLGSVLFLDDSPKVYAPLLLVNNNAVGGNAVPAMFRQQRHGGVGGVGRPAARRPVPQPSPVVPTAPPAPSPEAIAQLTAMGFDEQRVKEALQVTGNNVERAADILLTG